METKRMAKIYKALSNENRLAIFKEILEHHRREYEACKCSPSCPISFIKDKFKIGDPTISHHLKELANAELIITHKEGKYLIAAINRDVLEEVREDLRFL